ncbi:hypothetical protein MOX02_54410 [Methylobacterium oxalidis]|uniref:HTH marR-type domain-containing protein n=1 Tax=Methylobacterium oxalidis TaxID=944322 RepID=A0A512JBQ6_9HYPH|nr:hypothetical protein MOX02_54410 [Methylobacterium oxalidis]GLS67651.1 hypothetical protein GCM10007888_60360 [Methylobacterium oxalidis]
MRDGLAGDGKNSSAGQTRRVLEALTDEPMTAAGLAIRAGLPRRERTSAAERICEALERRGLAERGGTKVLPKWRRLGHR